MGHRVPFVIEPYCGLASAPRKSAAVKNLYSPLRADSDAPGRVEHCCPVSHRYSLIYALRLSPWDGGTTVPRGCPTMPRKKPRKCRPLFWGARCRIPSAPGRGNKGWGRHGCSGGGEGLRSQQRDRASANICHLLSLSSRKQRGI